MFHIPFAKPDVGMIKDSSTQQPIIELREVQKSYLSAAGEFCALRGINLQINAGEFVSVIGKSGSGKSTLLNMVTGIDRPTTGEVLVNGTAVHKLDENQLAGWRGDSLGIIFQFFQLLPSLSLLQNVILPMDLAGWLTTLRSRMVVAVIGALFIGPSMVLIAYFNDFLRGYYIAFIMSLAVFSLIWFNQPVFHIKFAQIKTMHRCGHPRGI